MDPKPYERQPGETTKQWAAFCLYRDLGPERSIDKAYAEYFINQSALKNKPPDLDSFDRAPVNWRLWSSKNSWVSRSLAYDEYCDEKRRKAREAKLRELEELRAAEEFRQQAIFSRRFDRCIAKLDKLEEMPNTDVSVTKTTEGDENNPPSKTVQKIKGLRLGDIARYSKETREISSVAAHGHIRRSISIRTDERVGSAPDSPAQGGPMYLVEDVWPEGQEPQIEGD